MKHDLSGYGGRDYLQISAKNLEASSRHDGVAKMLAHIYGSANEVEKMEILVNTVNAGGKLSYYEQAYVNRINRKYRHKLFNKGIVNWFRNLF